MRFRNENLVLIFTSRCNFYQWILFTNNIDFFMNCIEFSCLAELFQQLSLDNFSALKSKGTWKMYSANSIGSSFLIDAQENFLDLLQNQCTRILTLQHSCFLHCTFGPCLKQCSKYTLFTTYMECHKKIDIGWRASLINFITTFICIL